MKLIVDIGKKEYEEIKFRVESGHSPFYAEYVIAQGKPYKKDDEKDGGAKCSKADSNS